jgi:cobalamin biosynthesis Mg chelatase CobN
MLRVSLGQTGTRKARQYAHTTQNMKAAITRLVPTAIAIAALSPALAMAAEGEESVVPPSNSAAIQYTETFPTTGGDKETNQKPRHRSPAKVLGTQKAHKLEEQGPEGQAAAEAAAATAPSSVNAPQPESESASRAKGNGGAHGGGAKGGGGNPGSGAGAPGNGNGAAQVQAGSPAAPEEPGGSSGLGAAAGQATGLSSSGLSGPLLPLVILATVVWSLAYLWRQRRRVD